MPVPTPAAAGEELPEGVVTVSDVLAANVRAYRLVRRFEQEQLAERMVSLGHKWRRATVSEVERARRNVTVPELVALVVVLGKSVEQLLDPRGPGGRTGPGVGIQVKSVGDLDGTTDDWLEVQADDVTALICSHKKYAEVIWKWSRLHGIDVMDGRPDLTDVGPDGPLP